MSGIDWAAAAEAHRVRVDMDRRLTVLVEQRGLSQTLAGRVYATADQSFVTQLEAATDDQIADLNRGVEVANDFERTMSQAEQAMRATVADLHALADSLRPASE